MMRRLLTVAGTTIVLLVLTATTAFAHLCYNASRSHTGNQNAARAPALGSGPEFFEMLVFLGCEEEAAALEAALAADDIDPADVLVNERALMAAGLLPAEEDLGNPDAWSPLSTDGKGIDHLLPYMEELFAAFACAFPPPPPPD